MSNIPFNDNVGATSTTNTTGPIVLSGILATHRNVVDVLPDGAVRVFFAEDGTNYMQFTGTYTAAGTSISVDTVHHSSNGNAAPDWTGAVISIVITASSDQLTSMDLMVEGSATKILTAVERAKLAILENHTIAATTTKPTVPVTFMSLCICVSAFTPISPLARGIKKRPSDISTRWLTADVLPDFDSADCPVVPA